MFLGYVCRKIRYIEIEIEKERKIGNLVYREVCFLGSF